MIFVCYSFIVGAKKKLHSGDEEERFGELTLEFMSEESDPDENEGVGVHRPVWRSTSKSVIFSSQICLVMNNS